MRPFLTYLVVAAATTTGLISTTTTSATADTVCQQTDPATGICLVYVEVPGSPGAPGNPGDSAPQDTG